MVERQLKYIKKQVFNKGFIDTNPEKAAFFILQTFCYLYCLPHTNLTETKKATFLLVLAGILTACFSKAATPVDKVNSTRAVIQQTVQTQHKVYKKRRRVKRHITTRKSARAQMQLRQGQKHEAEEHRVKKAQQQLKKDTTKSN